MCYLKKIALELFECAILKNVLEFYGILGVFLIFFLNYKLQHTILKSKSDL